MSRIIARLDALEKARGGNGRIIVVQGRPGTPEADIDACLKRNDIATTPRDLIVFIKKFDDDAAKAVRFVSAAPFGGR